MRGVVVALLLVDTGCWRAASEPPVSSSEPSSTESRVARLALSRDADEPPPDAAIDAAIDAPRDAPMEEVLEAELRNLTNPATPAQYITGPVIVWQDNKKPETWTAQKAIKAVPGWRAVLSRPGILNTPLSPDDLFRCSGHTRQIVCMHVNPLEN